MLKIFALSLLHVFSLVLAACVPAATVSVVDPGVVVEEVDQGAMEDNADKMTLHYKMKTTSPFGSQVYEHISSPSSLLIEPLVWFGGVISSRRLHLS